MQELEKFDQVREILGEANPMARKKIYTHLNSSMQGFIASSPLVMVSTVDADGFPTISPKGDEAGFVRITDEGRLLIPELRGNKLAFSLANIVNKSKVALFFLVPGTSETLRVHGTCRLLSGDEISRSLASKTQQALLAIEVQVASAYFHCGKALLRSHLWQPEHWPQAVHISLGQQVADNLGESDEFAEDLDKVIKNRYITDF